MLNTNIKPNRFSTEILFLLFSSSFLTLVGCGPSKQELMMRSAMRARGATAEEEPPPKEKVAQAEPVTEAPEQKPTTPEPESPPEPEPEPTGEPIVDKSLAPIETRKAEQSLTNDDRRRRAYENLSNVSEALLAYARDKGNLPPTYLEANGFKTLSWRVELLPYLGHAELYKKFDKSVPWNRPPNKDLLELIPDPYVSPERFDTNTNIVMPARDGMIGGQRAGADPNNLEDGTSNTLLIIEVNDSMSVPWTAPEDFSPATKGEAKNGAVGLRKDGMFGVWANGWPVLLANELNEKIFWDAMTIDAGDGLQAGRYHRDIPIRKASKAATIAVEETSEAPVPVKQDRPPAMETVERNRTEVPSAGRIADAQSRFRDVFGKRLSEAKTDEAKAKLAQELVEASFDLSGNPVDAYTLQTAALRVAISGSAVRPLIEAIDQRVGQFEVDAYEENKTWLLAFGKGSKKDISNSDGIAYLERASRVVFAGVHDDDYTDTMLLVQCCSRFVAQMRDESIPTYLNQLRVLLDAANREFDGVKDAMAEYRRDPSNGEAAATIGRYLCFIKGSWEDGLPLLTRGGAVALQEIAALDMKGAEDYRNKVAIGDEWWALSEKARTDAYRESARDRAVYWYEQAFEVMPKSLDRMHVKSRLDEAEDGPRATPLALLRVLARELGVDLSVGLADVAELGKRSSYRGDDDDEDDD